MLEKSRLYEHWVKPHRNICDPVRMDPISYPFTQKKCSDSLIHKAETHYSQIQKYHRKGE